MQVKWTSKALNNLDDAVEYIAGDKPTASRAGTRVRLDKWAFHSTSS